MNVGYKELAEMGVALTPFVIRRKMRAGEFPKPVRGGRGLGQFEWDKSDVAAWLKAKKPSTRR